VYTGVGEDQNIEAAIQKGIAAPSATGTR
jgi:hypothetical protein